VRKQTAEEMWRKLLLGPVPDMRAVRALALHLPSPPRCELCAVPFKGPLAALLRPFGKAPFARNPRYCAGCCANLIRNKGGIELTLSFLFADVRGSTPLGEKLGPTGLHDLMDRFYQEGVKALFARGALLDRFMGDQVVGYFTPSFAGPNHAKAAVLCALDILRATGHDRGSPWIPVGAGVHTGEAFVGSVGPGADVAELTAIGDAVNVAARLASVAAPGEVLVSDAAFAAAGLEGEPERRQLSLKGVSATVPVRVLRLTEPADVPR
jgi:adenylate cyclase